ncbi:MAG: TonB family protein [Phaeodactylibacter sp.]|nr:TonB family protein [Phaeodactylibacter sp.]MCB9051076.1 TonB family protein [Lewinellaceae bacterium]
MITYIIQATFCWAVLYALYAGLLSRATFFNHNRAYLLGSLLLGLALPLVEWQLLLPAEQPELLVATLYPITIGMENLEVIVTATAGEPGVSWWEVLLAAYWLGVGIAALRFAYGLRKLWRLYRSSERRKQDSYTLVLTENWHAPFSFFNTLFWSRQMPYPPEDEKKIIRHELAHMRGWHSLDILLVEVLGIVFWLSPMIYLYSRSLRVVHEYLADAAVLQTTRKKKQYGHLLLSQSQSGQPIVLANHFINSQLKKRILMMTKTRSKRHMLIRYLLVAPLIFGLIVALAAPENMDWKPQVFNTLSASFDQAAFEGSLTAALSGERTSETLKHFGNLVKEAVEQYPEEEGAIKESAARLAAAYSMKLFWEGNTLAGLRFNPGPFAGISGPNQPGDVDRMPVFAGCEAMETEKAQEECTKQKLVEFMSSKLKYPEEAKAANAEGLVVVQFTVAKDGSVQDAKVVKSVGHGCDEAALAVVNAMPDWTPAMKDGQPVSMQMSLPFSFKLPSGQAQVGQENEEVFKVVEEMPRFPGCEEEGLSGQELVQCSNMKLITYIANNLKYPRDAKDAGVEGVAIVSFIVDKEGWVKDFKVVRPLHESIDAEVIRVVREMNEMNERWIPGRQKGKVVNVQFNLPVKFRLDVERKQLQLPEGAKDLQLQNFKVAPNPTSGLLNLQFEAEAQPTVIRILNSNGQEVIHEALNRFEGSYSQDIDLSKLPKGPYVLHISQGERIFAEKVILR